mmetsp:Transcript_2433/g.5038  ORF Transcript_2433/g.5038 Transcript_2433/m.5038 type:complete len:91 (+) Transcript_2433:301-573(+)
MPSSEANWDRTVNVGNESAAKMVSSSDLALSLGTHLRLLESAEAPPSRDVGGMRRTCSMPPSCQLRGLSLQLTAVPQAADSGGSLMGLQT